MLQETEVTDEEIEFSDDQYRAYMEKASRQLADCINRARAGRRVGAPKGEKRKGVNAGRLFKWTPEQVAEVNRLRAKGFTYEQIGRKVGKSCKQVEGVIRRRRHNNGAI